MEKNITIALAGNPNSGKTTLFNALTGSNQYVGNWPGVTVEKKVGRLRNNKNVKVADLPGIYSLSPYTTEEIVARNFLIDEKPDVILNIIDGTNLERNLYLTTQLAELGIPMTVAVNMTDLLSKSGDTINIEKLSKILGCEVLEISALKGTGVTAAADAAIRAAEAGLRAKHAEYSKELEGYLKQIGGLIGSVPENLKRWYEIKVFERDDQTAGRLDIPAEAEAVIRKAEEEYDDDSESIITDERYKFIARALNGVYRKKGSGEMSVSDRIDTIVTNRWLALPIFLAVMFCVYFVSVTTVGTWVTDWTNDGLFGDGYYLFGNGRQEYTEAMDEYYAENVFTPEVMEKISAAADEGITGADEILAAAEEGSYEAFEEAYGSYGEELDEKADGAYSIADIIDTALGEEAELPENVAFGTWIPGIPVLAEGFLDSVGCAEFVKALILDGIIAGVGAVLGFVPQMLVLFFFLAFLEGCGYMARIAFVMDRLFRRFGLSGKSFIPVLIGTGCGVPGIMASRTIENERDRRMTIMTTTFIPCGAKLPIIALISAALFGNQAWVAVSAYFLGIGAIVVSGIILKKTKMFAGDPAPFVMELPAYHWPTAGNVLRSMWERGWSFIKKAGSIILLSSILIWAASTFGWSDGAFGWNPDLALEESILGAAGSAVKWIFAPLGFANIKATVATVMGLVAKEEVVGVFGVLDFEGLTPLAGYSFLAFNLLCAPCFAAIGAIRREMNSAKWTWFAVIYQCCLAYAVSLIIYQIGSLVCGSGNIIGTSAALALCAAIVWLLVRPYHESLRLDTLRETTN